MTAGFAFIFGAIVGPLVWEACKARSLPRTEARHAKPMTSQQVTELTQAMNDLTIAVRSTLMSKT